VCLAWSQALDITEGIRSARARQAVTGMRETLRTIQGRAIPAARELDARARQYLSSTRA
jgi:hypothetical protein